MDYAVNGEMTVLTVFSRCVLKRGLGAVIKRDFKEIEPRFSQLVSMWMGAECTANIESMRVRHYVNWATTITVATVCVVVITVVAVYLALRQKRRDVKHLQKEINSNTDPNASLLV